ncbi:type I-E CRISPR-associated protein Cas5/CasD [Alloalcanivorax marinus]|uniref:type I-E CRISPR-associated protein Cas5/CasD n=1 Tax=Alloalcanivorax marinus TaxID=1177169 RepID=UPI0021D37802|nr:type I-E CRISPR-associated protein Cas5/CasD [Alloalcanivorax marinus]MCU5787332.1 CRISPR-associated Cas5e family protein [Alloalcanivorax marinus]
MSEYLVFRLYAPLASWGEAAVGETRPSGTCPGRGALLGLLGAALGLRRDDAEGQAALFGGFRVAVKQYRAGTLLSDYHTAQVPASQSRVRYRTRRDELNAPRKVINTILSSRQYRCDGLWTVAIQATPAARQNLSTLRDALLKPVFPLYLGRRACPLAAPLAPEVVDCDSLKAALDHEFEPLVPGQQAWLRDDAACLYAWEGRATDLDGDDRHVESNDVWDDPLNRDRWQFGPRKAFRRYQDAREVA